MPFFKKENVMIDWSCDFKAFVPRQMKNDFLNQR